jgi:hypothetical protein
MTWVETESLSFTARHDTGDTSYAQRTLDRLEELRLRLEDRFDAAPGEVTVVIHTNPAWLALAHPFLPAARWSAAPAGRRYLAGWAMSTELHVLNDPHMDRRAAGEDSREALRGTAERLYAQLVIAANNPDLPPSWTPRRFGRYLRCPVLRPPGRALSGGRDPPPARRLPALLSAIAARRRDPRRYDLRPARAGTGLGGLPVTCHSAAPRRPADTARRRLRRSPTRDRVGLARLPTRDRASVPRLSRRRFVRSS